MRKLQKGKIEIVLICLENSHTVAELMYVHSKDISLPTSYRWYRCEWRGRLATIISQNFDHAEEEDTYICMHLNV
jgi:hypothetical protein